MGLPGLDWPLCLLPDTDLRRAGDRLPQTGCTRGSSRHSERDRGPHPHVPFKDPLDGQRILHLPQ